MEHLVADKEVAKAPTKPLYPIPEARIAFQATTPRRPQSLTPVRANMALRLKRP